MEQDTDFKEKKIPEFIIEHDLPCLNYIKGIEGVHGARQFFHNYVSVYRSLGMPDDMIAVRCATRCSELYSERVSRDPNISLLNLSGLGQETAQRLRRQFNGSRFLADAPSMDEATSWVMDYLKEESDHSSCSDYYVGKTGDRERRCCLLCPLCSSFTNANAQLEEAFIRQSFMKESFLMSSVQSGVTKSHFHAVYDVTANDKSAQKPVLLHYTQLFWEILCDPENRNILFADQPLEKRVGYFEQYVMAMIGQGFLGGNKAPRGIAGTISILATAVLKPKSDIPDVSIEEFLSSHKTVKRELVKLPTAVCYPRVQEMSRKDKPNSMPALTPISALAHVNEDGSPFRKLSAEEIKAIRLETEGDIKGDEVPVTPIVVSESAAGQDEDPVSVDVNTGKGEVTQESDGEQQATSSLTTQPISSMDGSPEDTSMEGTSMEGGSPEHELEDDQKKSDHNSDSKKEFDSETVGDSNFLDGYERVSDSSVCGGLAVYDKYTERLNSFRPDVPVIEAESFAELSVREEEYRPFTGSMVSVPLLKVEELTTLCIFLDNAKGVVLERFINAVLSGQVLNMELVTIGDSEYAYLFFVPGQGKHYFSTLRNGDVRQILGMILRQSKVKKYCYMPYMLISHLRLSGFDSIKGVCPIYSLSSVLYPGHSMSMEICLEELGSTKYPWSPEIIHGDLSAILKYIHCHHRTYETALGKAKVKGLLKVAYESSKVDEILSHSFLHKAPDGYDCLFYLKNAATRYFPSTVHMEMDGMVAWCFCLDPDHRETKVVLRNLLENLYDSRVLKKCQATIIGLGSYFVTFAIPQKKEAVLRERVLLEIEYVMKKMGVRYLNYKRILITEQGLVAPLNMSI